MDKLFCGFGVGVFGLFGGFFFCGGGDVDGVGMVVVVGLVGVCVNGLFWSE